MGRSFLVIDHVHNDGNHERNILKITGQTLQIRLAKLDIPDPRYQILCANCNYSKMLLGECEHKSSYLEELYA